MRIGGGIGQAVEAHIVGKMVAAAVRDGAIAAGKFWRCPHPIILKAAVNEDDRFAMAGLHVGKFGAVDGDPLDVIGHDRGADRAGNEQSSSSRAGKIATRHSSCHANLQSGPAVQNTSRS
jgi:hypothetical protein